MSKATLFVIILIIGSFIGNEFIRNTIDIIWIGAGLLFVVFLFVHSWMDKKGMFLPKKKDKKG